MYASSDHEKVKAKHEELVAQYSENYLAIYDVPLDMDLNTLDHYPSSVDWGKEGLNKTTVGCLADARSIKKYRIKKQERKGL